MPTITIFLENGLWCADMTHAINAEVFQDLFDTYILPTAFTAGSTTGDVAKELARRNPGHDIVVPF